MAWRGSISRALMSTARTSSFRSTSRLRPPPVSAPRFQSRRLGNHRCPVEMSVCVETLQPFHTATASALMTSMLTISRTGYGWLPEGVDDTS